MSKVCPESRRLTDKATKPMREMLAQRRAKEGRMSEDDLKARLRALEGNTDDSAVEMLALEAADRIEQLEAELVRATNEINAMKDALAQCQCK